jgi:subtilisin family serine protease
VGVEAAGFTDTAQFTWGLQATRVSSSNFSGQGVPVAVLDTGLDLQHPDFVGRPIVSQSFVAGQTAQDGNRHGTHCTGTACGVLLPPGGVRRYGCAHQASIYVGKVLSNSGPGTDAQVLNGLNWAVTNRCRIVSMSLGAPVQPGQPFSQVFESVARRALAANVLLIAAAGNDSRGPDGRRLSPPAPVSHPANCPSIMAVAALDGQLAVAPFSNGGINPNGGQVDIAGPGVAVFSSLPVASGLRGVLSGTSMAAPHVAGIAALHLQARGIANTSAQALWQILVSTAKRLNLPALDIGAGLVQAPV